MARPTSKPLERRIELRITADELARIDEQASRASLTRSEYIRRRALGLKVKSRYDEQVLNEMRRQGGLMKHLAAAYPACRGEFVEALGIINKTMLEIYARRPV